MRFIYLVLFFTSACVHNSNRHKKPITKLSTKKTSTSPPLTSYEKEVFFSSCTCKPDGDLIQLNLQRFSNGVPSSEKDPDQMGKFPILRNDLVDKWINYFAGKGFDTYQRFLNRGEKYLPMIQRMLKQEGMPQVLSNLPFIESGFSSFAKSRAKALGLWQFMKGTGRQYSLKINSIIDERLDPVLSTEAALIYLGDLGRVFHSWPLALAAYNSGPMRVFAAIMRHNTRDYWQLVEEKALPKETRNYVAKFMAVAIIGRNLRYYGFKKPPHQDIYARLASVKIPYPVSLRIIAKKIGITYQQLKKLNPGLKRGYVPYPNYAVWLPKEKNKILLAHMNELRAHRIRGISERSIVRGTAPSTHRVRPGENLYLIARRYGVTISQLRRSNSLKSSKIYPGMKLSLPSTRHKVRAAESLYSIAKHYGISLKALKKANGLHSNKIIIGMRLNIPTTKEYASRKDIFQYRVTRGDSLYAIARKFKISLKKLKRLNGLKRSHKIYPGQLLKIEKSS